MKAMAMVPTYNEALNIESLLREILQQGPDIGAVVVDDNSPDGTAAIVKKLRQEDPRVHLVLRVEERGRGTAGIVGFQYAVAQGVEFVIEMDADFSHQPSYISYFLNQMENCDLLIGSRLVEGGGERGRHFLRQWITRLANAYIRLVLSLPVRDCTSGYRVFRREVLQAIDMDQIMSTGPSVVEEVLYKAYKRGFRIKEVPYILEERKAGESTFNRKIMLNALKMMIKIRWKYRNYPQKKAG
jgi:dolichol-phosphate mannosyltransferase